jgi:hypothetical protein
MGALIPATDQRLGKLSFYINQSGSVLTSPAAIEQNDDFRVNAASDFITQYTRRQEYRALPDIIDARQGFMGPTNNGKFVKYPP